MGCSSYWQERNLREIRMNSFSSKFLILFWKMRINHSPKSNRENFLPKVRTVIMITVCLLSTIINTNTYFEAQDFSLIKKNLSYYIIIESYNWKWYYLIFSLWILGRRPSKFCLNTSNQVITALLSPKNLFHFWTALTVRLSLWKLILYVSDNWPI